MTDSLIFISLLFRDLSISWRSRLMKCIVKRLMVVVWPSRPIKDSRSLKDDRLDLMILFIELDQALNLSKGREIIKVLVLSFHPNKILVSSNLASAINFEMETRSSRCKGSEVSNGRPMMCIANKTAASARSLLSFMSTVTVVMSSMKTSAFPESFSSIFTDNGSALAKGLSELFSSVLGTLCWIGECSIFGSQSSNCRMAFARSVVDSDISPQKFGFGAPPKVRRRERKARFCSTHCVIV